MVYNNYYNKLKYNIKNKNIKEYIENYKKLKKLKKYQKN